MTIGLAIPGVETVHPREEIFTDPCFPMIGPASNPKAVRQPAVHYSSALNLPDGDIGEFQYQIPPWLRASNRDYWKNRNSGGAPKVICGVTLTGYAIGYCFAVDWLGGAWEIRGFDIKAAANAPSNEWTAPIIFITDGASRGMYLQWKTARAIWREFRRRSGRSDFADEAVGHGSLPDSATECPGAGLRADLAAGYGKLDYPEQGDDMKFDFLARMERMHDSRLGYPQATNVVQTLLTPGEKRKVPLGVATTHGVRVTVVNASGPGYVSITGTPGLGDPIVNMWDGQQGDGTLMLDTPDGHGYLSTTVSCDVIVDVWFRGVSLED